MKVRNYYGKAYSQEQLRKADEHDHRRSPSNHQLCPGIQPQPVEARPHYDFQYAVATSSKEAKEIEKKITTDFEALAVALEQPQWEEAQVLLMIKSLRRSIVNITSLR